MSESSEHDLLHEPNPAVEAYLRKRKKTKLDKDQKKRKKEDEDVTLSNPASTVQGTAHDMSLYVFSCILSLWLCNFLLKRKQVDISCPFFRPRTFFHRKKL